MGRTSRIVVVGGKETGKTSILEKAIYANSTLDKVMYVICLIFLLASYLSYTVVQGTICGLSNSVVNISLYTIWLQHLWQT